MIFRNQPSDFKKQYDIVGCFIVSGNRFLLLRRHSHKANGGKWGLPAGKVDPGESIQGALLREVEEETGLKLSEESVLPFDSLHVRDGMFDIKWHMFSYKLDDKLEIYINSYEHSDYQWVTPEEAFELDLIHDLPESISLFYDLPFEKSVGLIPVTLNENDIIICLAVQHADGHWGVPKGHPEPGETEAQTATRELLEETGLSAKNILTEPVFTENYVFERGGKKVFKENRYYIGLLDRQDPKTTVQFKNEIKQSRWVPFDPLIDLLEHKSAKEFVQSISDYIERNRKEIFE